MPAEPGKRPLNVRQSMPAEPGYAALLMRLYRSRRFGAVLELSRIAGALATLEHPERRVGRIVHVGGTNGKGSTAAFFEALALEAGLRVAVFSSPHLSQLVERFRIDGVPIAVPALVDAAERVERADSAGRLTFFELVTAMALCAFADAAVDVCVLEVGLGGRFDATNAVTSDVAVVTGVALDHQQHLGDTVEAIAAEKAGIFRPGSPAVVGAAGEPKGAHTLARIAREVGCVPVKRIGEAELSELAGIELGLAGGFQRANAAAAVAVCRTLAVPADLGALSRARLAARLETVCTDPLILVDGAHNAHAVRTLLAELGDRPFVAVVGVSDDKDAAAIVGPIAARARAVVATQSRQDRAAPAEVVARVARGGPGGSGVSPTNDGGRGRLARRGPPVHVVPRVADAIERARELAVAGDAIVIAGSLFVAAEAREHVLWVVPDPVPLADPPVVA